jgi:hypothetical protein
MRTLRARRRKLEHERLALWARCTAPRARAEQASLHARLVHAAAGHTILLITEALAQHTIERRGEVRGYRLPVATFSELVATFLEEITALHCAAETADRPDGRLARTARLATLIAQGRELQRRPPHLTLLALAPQEERGAYGRRAQRSTVDSHTNGRDQDSSTSPGGGAAICNSSRVRSTGLFCGSKTTVVSPGKRCCH